MPDDAALRARFDTTGNAPHAWRWRAAELFQASHNLYKQFYDAIEFDPPRPPEALELSGPALMLRAMAVECLLKALALDNGSLLARDGQYQKLPRVREHDLLRLARAVRIDLSHAEEGLLRLLSRHITAGRYPIQRRWTEAYRRTPRGVLHLDHELTPAQDEVCEALVKRITNKTPWVLRAEWP